MKVDVDAVGFGEEEDIHVDLGLGGDSMRGPLPSLLSVSSKVLCFLARGPSHKLLSLPYLLLPPSLD